MISLTCGIYKGQTHRNRVEWWLPGAGDGGRGDVGQRVQISSYKISSGRLMHIIGIIASNTVLYT